MSIMLTLFDVSLKEKSAYGSLCFELLPQLANEPEKKKENGPVPACK